MKMILASFLLVFVSCGSHEKVADIPASDTMTPATEQVVQEKQEVTEINFKKGDEKLSGRAKEQLDALLEKFGDGKISKIRTITWGDLDYPSVYNSKDVEDDSTLVVKRNLELGSYLKKLTEAQDIEMFNMAERTTAINKIAIDENIQESLESAGIPNTDTAVKVPGKASKSIVIFIKEEE